MTELNLQAMERVRPLVDEEEKEQKINFVELPPESPLLGTSYRRRC